MTVPSPAPPALSPGAAPLLSRRRVLGGGAFLVLGLLSGALFARRPLPQLDSPCLGSGPLRTLQLALAALLDDDDRAASLARGVDTFLATGDPVAASQLRMALRLLEHGSVLFGRFSRLDADGRVTVLRAWEGSRVNTRRQVFQALRRLAAFSGYSDPRSWDEIAYEGTWLDQGITP